MWLTSCGGGLLPEMIEIIMGDDNGQFPYLRIKIIC